MKALSQTIQKLWPILKLSNQQTNKQTGQKQYVPDIATGDIKKQNKTKHTQKKQKNKNTLIQKNNNTYFWLWNY